MRKNLPLNNSYSQQSASQGYSVEDLTETFITACNLCLCGEKDLTSSRICIYTKVDFMQNLSYQRQSSSESKGMRTRVSRTFMRDSRILLPVFTPSRFKNPTTLGEIWRSSSLSVG